jgi:hypothetical protein
VRWRDRTLISRFVIFFSVQTSSRPDV